MIPFKEFKQKVLELGHDVPTYSDVYGYHASGRFGRCVKCGAQLWHARYTNAGPMGECTTVGESTESDASYISWRCKECDCVFNIQHVSVMNFENNTTKNGYYICAPNIHYSTCFYSDLAPQPTVSIFTCTQKIIKDIIV